MMKETLPYIFDTCDEQLLRIFVNEMMNIIEEYGHISLFDFYDEVNKHFMGRFELRREYNMYLIRKVWFERINDTNPYLMIKYEVELQ